MTVCARLPLFIPIMDFSSHILRTRGIITIMQCSLTSTSVDLSTIISPISSRVRALISLSLGLGMCPTPTLYTHIAPLHLYIYTMLCRIPSDNHIRDIPLIEGGNAGRQVDGSQSAMSCGLITTCRSCSILLYLQ